MIVDCHTHVNFEDSQFGPDQHFAAAEQLDACIVLAGADSDSKKTNKALSEYVDKHSKKMFGFAVVNPVVDDVSVKYWSHIKNRQKLDGAVLYCCRAGFHPAHSRAMQFYETAAELNLPLFFHNTPPFAADSILDYARPYLLDEIARKFDSLKIIIGSMGAPFVNETICMLAKHENVYADLTVNPAKVWGIYNVVLNCHEAGVLDKLLFGSGLPAGDVQKCI